MDIDIIYITELLERYVEKLKFAEKLTEAVTYHDPCYLGRGSKIYESPRNILSKISDTKLLEMPRTRNLAFCCGAGGGVNLIYPDFSKWCAKERIQEAKDTGANLLITACPVCKSNMQDVDDSLKVLDITEYISQNLKTEK